MKRCPFKAGDIVVYKPSVRGRGLVIMTIHLRTTLDNLTISESSEVQKIDLQLQ